MVRKGFTLVEVLLALILLGGVAYLASQLALQGAKTAQGVVQGQAAAANLSDGLGFVRNRLNEYPIPVLLQGGDSSFTALQRIQGPYPLARALRGSDELYLRSAEGIAPMSLLLLYGPDGRAFLTSVAPGGVQAQGDGSVRVKLACALPFSHTDGLLVYRVRPLFVAMGSALQGVSGASPDTLYWSENGAVWRPVVGKVSRFEVKYRYRKEAVGEVLENPAGFLNQGVPLPSVTVGGAVYYLTELALYAQALEGNRDYQVLVSLAGSSEGVRVRNLVGCGASASQGNLRVEVTGLPQGALADVLVEGPNGYRQTLTASADLSVSPGSYTVSAREVSHGGTLYEPEVSGSPATVPAGGEARVRVEYGPVDPAYIGVRVDGLPQGACGPVGVWGQSAQVASECVSPGGRGTIFQVRARRSHEVRALETTVGGRVYRPVGWHQSQTVPPLNPGQTHWVSVSYYCSSCPSTLRLNINWVPSRPANTVADVWVQFPDGTRRQFTESAVLDTVSGPHLVDAYSVLGSDGFTYRPSPSSQTVTPPEGGTGEAGVTYENSEGIVRVRVEGLPQGLTPYWGIANRGYTDRQKTLVLPAKTTYWVTANQVDDPNDRFVAYLPTAEPHSFYLGPGQTVDVVIRYQSRVMGGLRVYLRSGRFQRGEIGLAVKASSNDFGSNFGSKDLMGGLNGYEHLVPTGSYRMEIPTSPDFYTYWNNIFSTNYGRLYELPQWGTVWWRREGEDETQWKPAVLNPIPVEERKFTEIRVDAHTSTYAERSFPLKITFAFPGLNAPPGNITFQAKPTEVPGSNWLNLSASPSGESASWEGWLCLDRNSNTPKECTAPFSWDLYRGITLAFNPVQVGSTTYWPNISNIQVPGMAVSTGAVSVIRITYTTERPSYVLTTFDMRVRPWGRTGNPDGTEGLQGYWSYDNNSFVTSQFRGIFNNEEATLGLPVMFARGEKNLSYSITPAAGTKIYGLLATPPSAAGNFNISMVPAMGLYNDVLTGSQAPVPLSNFTVEEGLELYLKSRPTYPQLEYAFQTTGGVEPKVGWRSGVVPFVVGSGRFLLPQGQYTLRLATDGTTQGRIRVVLRDQDGRPYDTRYSYGVPACQCSEVSFVLPKGHYVEITATR